MKWTKHNTESVFNDRSLESPCLLKLKSTASLNHDRLSRTPKKVPEPEVWSCLGPVLEEGVIPLLKYQFGFFFSSCDSHNFQPCMPSASKETSNLPDEQQTWSREFRTGGTRVEFVKEWQGTYRQLYLFVSLPVQLTFAYIVSARQG